MDKILDIAINSIRIDLPDKKKYLFKNIHLQIKTNSIYAIVGENGAGKSTIVKILYGFYNADSGKIFINGKIRCFTILLHYLILNYHNTLL